MAAIDKTANERAKRYRERLKQSGGKNVNITLSADEVELIKVIGKQYYPNSPLENVPGHMVRQLMRRLMRGVKQQIRLVEEFRLPMKAADTYAHIDAETVNREMAAEEFIEVLQQRLSQAATSDTQ